MARLWLGPGKKNEPEPSPKEQCTACGGVGQRNVEHYSNKTRQMTEVYETCPDCKGSGEQ